MTQNVGPRGGPIFTAVLFVLALVVGAGTSAVWWKHDQDHADCLASSSGWCEISFYPVKIVLLFPIGLALAFLTWGMIRLMRATDATRRAPTEGPVEAERAG